MSDDLIKLLNARAAAKVQGNADEVERDRIQRLSAADQKIMQLLDITIEACAITAMDVLQCTQVTGEMIQWAMDMHTLAEKSDKRGLERRFAAIAVKFLNKLHIVQEQRASDAAAEGAKNGV